MFWAAPHGLHGKAAELVARHGAVVVRGMTANEFFPGLPARVEALGQRAEPAPTRELSVARLKRALPDPVRRIDLHELVDAEALRVVARPSDGDRYPPGERAPDAKAYRELLERYRSDCDTLLHLLAVGAWRGEGGAHARVWVRALQRPLNVPRDGGGRDDAPHLCPALLALAAAGVGAVLAGRDELLGRLLLEPVLAQPSGLRPARGGPRPNSGRPCRPCGRGRCSAPGNSSTRWSPSRIRRPSPGRRTAPGCANGCGTCFADEGVVLDGTDHSGTPSRRPPRGGPAPGARAGTRTAERQVWTVERCDGRAMRHRGWDAGRTQGARGAGNGPILPMGTSFTVAQSGGNGYLSYVRGRMRGRRTCGKRPGSPAVAGR